MFDSFRKLGQSAEQKRSELLNTYLDGELTERERSQLEAQLQQDAALRAELAQMQFFKQQVRQMPRRRVPRSFTLDPALYSPPKPQRSQQLYPVLRGATALAAFLFVFVLGLSLFNTNFAGNASSAETVAMTESQALEAAPEESAAAELAQALPEAAAIVADEPPPAEMAAGAAADTDGAEDLSLEESNPAEGVEESARNAAESGALKETAPAGAPIATVSAETVESYAAADEVAAVEVGPEAIISPDAVLSPQATFPYQTIAIVLAVATLILGLLTLMLRGRSRL